jgi:hypothetical protein
VFKKLLRPPLLTALLAACLFCVVAGLKWATFDRFGSAMPDWDQWDAEATHLLTSWVEKDHFVQHLFEPHNEHRVVLTKLQNLTVTLLNGQWDARLEAATNALVHSALAVALWLIARRRLPAYSHAPLWLLAVVLFGFPLAWQNVLGGFHSQQYWLLLLSFASIAVLPFARPWSAAWWAAGAAATLALFTMGSGMLAAAVVIVVVAFRLWRKETSLRAAWPALALCAALVTVGALTRVEVPYHAHMKAKSLHDFFFSLVHSLQWPVPSGRDWLAIVMWAPWVLAAGRVWREREPVSSRTGQIILALGGWVLVQLLATAYARGANADFPASRYMDTLTFGAMVNGLALAWLLACDSRLARRIALGTLTLAWVATLGFGLRALLDTNLNHEMPHAKKYYGKAEVHMRGYLATNDPRQLAFPDIPYPSADGIIERLSHPGLRALMPAVIRPPLPVKAATTGPFLENNASQLTPDGPRIGTSPLAAPYASARTWGSWGTSLGLAATGEWRSEPLTSPLGSYLKFEMAGPIGEDPQTIALELRDAKSDALLATVAPSKKPGDTWRAAYAKAPSGPFVIVARDSDPGRWLAFSAPVEMGRLSYWAFRATQRGLLFAELAGALALALGIAVLIPARTPRPAKPRPPVAPKPAKIESKPKVAEAPRSHWNVSFAPVALKPLALAGLLGCLFLTIWGCKLMAIDRYGSDLPYWDQWAKEGDHLLIPWFEKHELWANLVKPHNEHRMAPTLALNLALVVAGGQWDARVQCVVNGALHAMIALGFFAWALRRYSLPWALASGGILALATAPPIGWENVLGGFQSQFYFLAGFSFLALAGLLTASAWSLRWFGGLFCGFLALISMGSGLLVAGPLVVICGARLFARGDSRRDALITLGAAVVLGGLGAVLRTPAPWHEGIHAHSVGQFIDYALRCMAWPLPQYPWLAPLIWAPWGVLLWTRAKQLAAGQNEGTQSADFLLAAGAWVLLQIAAVTYSRAGGGGPPASRYGDIAAFGLMVSFLSLAQLATQGSRRHRQAAMAAALHFAIVAVCVIVATRDVVAGSLADKKREFAAFERNVQAFVLTDDYPTFEKSQIPFPLADWLARILRRPEIRAVLPASVRAPVHLDGFSTTPTPPAPPLWERRTQSLVAAGDRQSTALPRGTMSWWKIETAGPGFSGQPLALRLTEGGKSFAVAASRAPQPNEWRAGYVPAPRGPATLEAKMADAERWLAFTEPVEVSSLSYRTWQVAKQGGWVFGIGLAGALALAGAMLRRRLIFSRSC